jgi:hypothetical protein
MISIMSDGSQEFFVYTNPTFDALENCQQFTQENAGSIRMNMIETYGPLPIDSIWCVREDKLQLLLETENPNKET